MNLQQAIQAVVDGPTSQLNWAKNYAVHALQMMEVGATNGALHHQLLYLVGNLGSWRGDTAREAKKVIRQAIKDLA